MGLEFFNMLILFLLKLCRNGEKNLNSLLAYLNFRFFCCSGIFLYSFFFCTDCI